MVRNFHLLRAILMRVIILALLAGMLMFSLTACTDPTGIFGSNNSSSSSSSGKLPKSSGGGGTHSDSNNGFHMGGSGSHLGGK